MPYESSTKIIIIFISWTFHERSEKQGKEANTNLIKIYDFLSWLKNLAIHEN